MLRMMADAAMGRKTIPAKVGNLPLQARQKKLQQDWCSKCRMHFFSLRSQACIVLLLL